MCWPLFLRNQAETEHGVEGGMYGLRAKDEKEGNSPRRDNADDGLTESPLDWRWADIPRGRSKTRPSTRRCTASARAHIQRYESRRQQESRGGLRLEAIRGEGEVRLEEIHWCEYVCV